MPILATSELAEQRLAICKDCPLFNGVRCKACGCFMQIKARLHNVTCPHGIWEHKDYTAITEKPTPGPIVAERLKVCDVCPNRRGRRCNGCDCNIQKLAIGKVESCPLRSWFR